MSSYTKSGERKRICIVATVPVALKWFMAPHIASLKADHEVTLVSSGSAEDVSDLLDGSVSFRSINIERKVSITKDVISLIKLFKLFRKEKFDCVHSIMPKSGLLSMLAARLAGVPLRFHTFTGQVWATRRGGRRLVLKFLDKVLARNATQVLADSRSQRLFLIKNKVAKAQSITVLADGSVTGVNVDRFQFNMIVRQQVRKNLQIPNEAIVFLFVGRLTRDKGLLELSRAFQLAAKKNENLHLLIVGPDEDGCEIETSMLESFFTGRVHRVGFTHSPENYMSAADVFCLPSHREGFGSVIIEAAAVGLPVIASRIYGIIDAVEDGVTGILHSAGSDREIEDSMLLLASNKDLRLKMGSAARARAISKFAEARVTEAFSDFYRDMFSKSGI